MLPAKCVLLESLNETIGDMFSSIGENECPSTMESVFLQEVNAPRMAAAYNFYGFKCHSSFWFIAPLRNIAVVNQIYLL